MKFLLKLSLALFPMCSIALAQTNDSSVVTMQTVVVTANQIPQNSIYVNRSITVVDGPALNSLPAASPLEALESSANIHLQPRVPFGVQSDISIRGSLFGQQLILIDGMRFNDPQTGHHDSDIPIPGDGIGRIEVLKTPASAQHGADAFGGIINFIPRKATQSYASLSLAGGEHGLASTSGTVALASPMISTLNTIEHTKSNAYGTGNDFKVTNISSSNVVDIAAQDISVLGGYSNREFGAYHFYVLPTDNSPSREWTETFFTSASTELNAAPFTIKPSLLYKIHHDKFLYDPALIAFVPENLHTDHLYDGQVIASAAIDGATTVVGGVEYITDDIISSNLGKHTRTTTGIHLAGQTVYENMLSLDAGIRVDVYSDYANQVNPNVGIGYLFNERGKLFFTAGKSFRTPSYTDLYYKSPTTAGNPLLNPETAYSYELGLEQTTESAYKYSLSVYSKDQNNMIDYILNAATYGDRKFHAVNLTRAVIHGVDASVQKAFGDRLLNAVVSLNYSYIDSKVLLQSSDTSRYAFTHPRHQIGATLITSPISAMNVSVSAVYKIKLDGTSYTLVDSKIAGTYSSVTAYIKGTNLLNETYQEIVGVTLPGRWLWAGVEYSLSL